MAYFPNGMSADHYYNTFCMKCVHEGDCAVWMAHLIHNYDECNNDKSILHDLIPEKDGAPQKCRMFIEAPSREP